MHKLGANNNFLTNYHIFIWWIVLVYFLIWLLNLSRTDEAVEATPSPTPVKNGFQLLHHHGPTYTFPQSSTARKSFPPPLPRFYPSKTKYKRKSKFPFSIPNLNRSRNKHLASTQYGHPNVVLPPFDSQKISQHHVKSHSTPKLQRPLNQIPRPSPTKLKDTPTFSFQEQVIQTIVSVI